MSKDKTQTNHTISDPESWVASHGDYLFRYAYQRLGDKSLAEDIVQETFLAALKARHNFAGQSSERTWFIGILKRKVVDHFRKQGREMNLKDEKALDQLKDDSFISSSHRRGDWKAGRKPAEWMIDESDSAEKKEFWEFLKRCLTDLPRNLAIVFIMREMEELENEEIGNVLELTPTNLRVILYRARMKLRKCLEENWIGVRKKAR